MTKAELGAINATHFRERLIFGGWWLVLCNDAGKNVGEVGPFEWAMMGDVKADAKALGLIDYERELGSRGK